MDGTLAVLFLAASLTDMGVNHCTSGQGCLAPSMTQERLSFSYGQVIFQEDHVDEELYVKYDLGTQYGPFQPSLGASMTMRGDVWVGAGASWTTHFDSAYMQLSLMPGIYAQGNGPDLGSVIEFRSGIEFGFENRSGVRYAISYDHRSNADLTSVNPGMETLQFRVSIPMR